MVNTRRLIALAWRWQRFAADKKRRISFPRSSECPLSSVANGGHFVLYTAYEKCYEFPLDYLRSNIFVELLRMSEEEFGVPSDGPITLPCESMFLEYVVRLVHGQIREDLEKALITSMSTCKCFAFSSQRHLKI